MNIHRKIFRKGSLKFILKHLFIGEIIFRENNTVNNLYLIVKGEIGIYKSSVKEYDTRQENIQNDPII